jgi:hypothetical protein
MNGSVHSDGLDAGWWKAFHAACSAAALLMLLMLKVDACLDA